MSADETAKDAAAAEAMKPVQAMELVEQAGVEVANRLLLSCVKALAQAQGIGHVLAVLDPAHDAAARLAEHGVPTGHLQRFLDVESRGCRDLRDSLMRIGLVCWETAARLQAEGGVAVPAGSELLAQAVLAVAAVDDGVVADPARVDELFTAVAGEIERAAASAVATTEERTTC